MKTIWFYTTLFFLTLSVALAAEKSQGYDALAAELSQSLKSYSEISSHIVERPAKTGRDPLQPLMDAQGNILSSVYANSNLRVQGIVDSGASKVALINDHFFSPGDSVDPNNRILEIHTDGVVIQNEEGTSFMPLYPDAGSNS